MNIIVITKKNEFKNVTTQEGAYNKNKVNDGCRQTKCRIYNYKMLIVSYYLVR